MTTAVLIPVLDRPERAEAVTQSLLGVTQDVRLVFLAQRADRKEVKALTRAARGHPEVDIVLVPFHCYEGDYARKINHGVNITDEPWLFQGADDLEFTPGWLEMCLDVADVTGRRVIGTNDECNPRVRMGGHSTHSLVGRSYIDEYGTCDERGRMLHEGYYHNFCDDELVLTAKIRREFIAARSAIVRHLHPNCHEMELDNTYRRGLDSKQFMLDRQRFRSRQPLMRRPATGRRP